MNRFLHRLALALAVSFLAALQPAHAVSLEWTRQLGSVSYDESRGVSVDDLGNVYISGFTDGNLEGSSAGGRDAFVSKYDPAGNFQWTRQLGTTSFDESYSVSADGLGNVYISGRSTGSLDGTNAGELDAFVSKYDAVGNMQWKRQLGTTTHDGSYGVSADGLGNVYISGYTFGSLGGPSAGVWDAFVSKYDAAGNFQWIRQLGTSSYDQSHGVSADGLGNVYLSGSTLGSLGGPNAGEWDAFVSKYDAAGNFLWSQQLGTANTDISFGVSSDGLGNVYISGQTYGSLGGPVAGSPDAFVSKYDFAGNFQWTRQLGTAFDGSFGVSADGMGNVYISGATDGSLGGTSAGGADAFVSKYDAAGNLQWTKQLGTASSDESYGISADGLGNVYISGNTYGNLRGANAGSSDAFVAKFSDPIVPEPSTLALISIAPGLALATRRRR